MLDAEQNVRRHFDKLKATQALDERLDRALRAHRNDNKSTQHTTPSGPATRQASPCTHCISLGLMKASKTHTSDMCRKKKDAPPCNEAPANEAIEGAEGVAEAADDQPPNPAETTPHTQRSTQRTRPGRTPPGGEVPSLVRLATLSNAAAPTPGPARTPGSAARA